MTKYCQTILVLGLLAESAVTGFAQNSRIINSISALVQESVITEGDVKDLTEPVRRRYAKLFPDPEKFSQEYGRVIQDALNVLIERKLILADFKTAGGMLPEVVIDDEIKRRLRTGHRDRAEFIQTLKAEGRTYEAYRREVREEIIADYLREKHVAADIVISPYKIEAYYATNQSLFQVEDQVKLHIIRLLRGAGNDSEPARKRAAEILAKIESGTPFQEMIVNHEGSEPSDRGWVLENKELKGLSDIFFRLKARQHSGVVGRAVESDDVYWIYLYKPDGGIATVRKYGLNAEGKAVLVEERAGNEPALALTRLLAPQEFYLLYVEDVRSSHVRPLAEVREAIEQTLLVQEHARAQKKWIERLRGKIFVQTFF
jgi:hypothetical protein